MKSMFLRVAGAILLLMTASSVASAYTAYTTSTVNVRSGPGVSYGRIGSLPRGTRIDVVRCQTGWCNVRTAYLRGWISRNYISGASYNPPVIVRPPPVVRPPVLRPPAHHKPKPPAHKPRPPVAKPPVAKPPVNRPPVNRPPVAKPRPPAQKPQTPQRPQRVPDGGCKPGPGVVCPK